MKKALNTTLKVLVAIVLVLVILLAIIKIGERLLFSSFFFNARAEFKVPGISDNFVQQGFDYDSYKNRFIVSGYMKTGEASRVYVLDENGEIISYTSLKNADGTDYTGHCGGVAHYSGYVYISNDDNDDKSLDVFEIDTIMNGATEVKSIGSIYVHHKPAFCFINDGKLYTGNYHKDETDYLSPSEHQIGEGKAIMTVFNLDSSSPFGVNPTPVEAYSIPAQIQGMTMTEDGRIVLSSSWGLEKSILYIFDTAKAKASGTTTTMFGEDAIPLYALDSASLTKTVVAPPMAEELVCLDGRIYIMNESACNKYIFGKFTSGNYVYSYKLK